MDFGTAMHLAIEHYKPATGEPCENPIKIFEDEFNRLFEENSKNYEEGQKSRKTQLLETGARILWKLNDLPQLRDGTVLSNELELYEQIPGTSLFFKGYVDIVLACKDVLGDTWVYSGDIKTCFQPWSLNDLQDDGTLIQVLLYKYFMARKMDIDLADIRTAYIFLCKSPTQNPPVAWFEVNSSVAAIKGALLYLANTVKAMQAAVDTGVFEKNRSNCRNKYGLCTYLESEHCTSEDLTSEQLVSIKTKKQ